MFNPLDILYSVGAQIYIAFGLLALVALCVIEIVIIKYLGIKERMIRFLIAGMFLLTTLCLLWWILMPFFDTLSILSIFRQYSLPLLLGLFLSNLSVTIILIVYEKLSINKKISLKNTFIFLGGMQLIVLYLFSLMPFGWHLTVSYLFTFESLPFTTLFVFLPLASITAGIGFYLLSMLGGKTTKRV